MLKAGWYLCIYHDISWEENPYLRGIGGSCPPDLLREHVAALSQHGNLVSVQDGFEAWRSNSLERPTFSLWFDDGYAGVRQYALPILQERGIAAATAVCSRFVDRSELFWRCKLSFLSAYDGLCSFALAARAIRFVARRFGEELCARPFWPAADRADRRSLSAGCHETQSTDAFRLFDAVDGIRQLQQHGWLVTNHSAAHYPVTETQGIQMFADQYRESEAFLNSHLGTATRFWVAPFGRVGRRAPNLLEEFAACQSGGHLVLVDNQVNHPRAADHTVIKRIFMPIKPAKQAIAMLKRLPYCT